MCTAVSFNIENSLFGRNLDVECEYGERVIITPRNFTLKFKNCIDLSNHYAIIGVGIREGEYPLYFDAANEHGLAMAGLNFVGNAKYFHPYLIKQTLLRTSSSHTCSASSKA
jgi:choloylglycine hydrolase